MDSTNDRWVGPVEAAHILGVNRSTVQRWIDQNEIKGIKTVGGHRRVLESELRAFASRQGITITDVGLTRSILIVDDEPDIVDFLGELMRQSRPDLKVHTARTGFEAGRLISERRPALIFLDLHMPGLDGLEVCRFVHDTAMLSWIRIVGVTGERNPEVLKRFLAAGATEILRKPIDAEKLLAILEAVFPEPARRAKR